jgi:hypothetical protein
MKKIILLLAFIPNTFLAMEMEKEKQTIQYVWLGADAQSSDYGVSDDRKESVELDADATFIQLQSAIGRKHKDEWFKLKIYILDAGSQSHLVEKHFDLQRFMSLQIQFQLSQDELDALNKKKEECPSPLTALRNRLAAELPNTSVKVTDKSLAGICMPLTGDEIPAPRYIKISPFDWSEQPLTLFNLKHVYFIAWKSTEAKNHSFMSCSKRPSKQK